MFFQFCAFVFLSRLVTQTEVVDELAIAFEIVLTQVFQQTTTLADHHQQTATAMVILGMCAKVVCQFVDARGKECNLHGGAATIVLVELVLLNDVVLVGDHWAASSKVKVLMRKL